MKLHALVLIALTALSMTAMSPTWAMSSSPEERLGTVSFAISCAPAIRRPFNRGVALLHDFWYEEAQRQFELLTKADPHCAMAHWGVAMSVFHQIWDRPDEVHKSTLFL